MEPIFDQSGRTVGWLDSDVVRDPAGRAIAFIPRLAFLPQGAVYSYTPQHLGFFGDGFFRDRAGQAVAYLSNHSFGPITPIAQIPPIPPIPSIAPIPPIPPLPPIAPLPTLNWSHLSWDDFVAGKG
jgi:hypothetical protein